MYGSPLLSVYPYEEGWQLGSLLVVAEVSSFVKYPIESYPKLAEGAMNVSMKVRQFDNIMFGFMLIETATAII